MRVCVRNVTVIIQALTVIQILPTDLKRFGSLAWSVSFVLAEHISCNYITN